MTVGRGGEACPAGFTLSTEYELKLQGSCDGTSGVWRIIFTIAVPITLFFCPVPLILPRLLLPSMTGFRFSLSSRKMSRTSLEDKLCVFP